MIVATEYAEIVGRIRNKKGEKRISRITKVKQRNQEKMLIIRDRKGKCYLMFEEEIIPSQTDYFEELRNTENKRKEITEVKKLQKSVVDAIFIVRLLVEEGIIPVNLPAFCGFVYLQKACDYATREELYTRLVSATKTSIREVSENGHVDVTRL